MTAQIAERLRYQGEDVAMCTNPLSDYFAMGGTNPRFESNCTALWRGYVGSWEIIDDRLYLIGLNGTLEDGTDASLATIFPGFPDRVFAHWYSGTIRLPQGKQLEYVHGLRQHLRARPVLGCRARGRRCHPRAAQRGRRV